MEKNLKKYISIILWPMNIGVIVLIIGLYKRHELNALNVFKVIITAIIASAFLLIMYFIFKGIWHLLRNKTR